MLKEEGTRETIEEGGEETSEYSNLPRGTKKTLSNGYIRQRYQRVTGEYQLEPRIPIEETRCVLLVEPSYAARDRPEARRSGEFI